MWKFRDLHGHLKSLGLVTDENTHRPRDDPPHEWFEAVHEPEYYHAFLSGSLGEKAERRIGFGLEMRKPEVIKRTLLEASGTITTVELALKYGLAANLAGGTHHAHRDFGSGFTILNDLAVAIAWARANTHARRIGVVDLDVHQGDGTAAIFADCPDTFTMSMHCGSNFPFRKFPSDLDVDVPAGTGDRAYLAELRKALPTVLAASPDLVIYDAGVDIFAGDALGHLDISHAGIWQRDLCVLEACVDAGVPVAAVIGGGYDRDAAALARRHALLHRAAAQVWRRRKMG